MCRRRVAASRCRSFRSACRCHESTVAPFQIALDGASIASFCAVVGRTGRPGHGLTGRGARFNRQIFVSARWPFDTVFAIGTEIPLNRNAAAVRNGSALLHSPTIAEMTSSSLRVKVKKCGVVAQAGRPDIHEAKNGNSRNALRSADGGGIAHFALQRLAKSR